ncbi:MAG: OmpA family protein [Azoarcus sp.]|jgi:outer membrane protein OmpA-like peptidoglycan-associated protein|nr:OmpA family protein [Azoarcus sp.]
MPALLSRLLALATALLLAACAELAPLFQFDTVDDTPATDTSADANTPAVPETPVVVVAMDWESLQQELTSALQGEKDFHIDHLPRGLRLSLPAANGFSSGSAALQASLSGLLERIAPILERHDQLTIHIVGHTDSIGREMHNLKLSIQRAEAVMEHLRRRGIALARMSADGKGETEPIANNAQESERMRNRRVEIFLDTSGD